MKTKEERIAETMKTYRVLLSTTANFSNESINKLLMERDAKIRAIEEEAGE